MELRLFLGQKRNSIGSLYEVVLPYLPWSGDSGIRGQIVRLLPYSAAGSEPGKIRKLCSCTRQLFTSALLQHFNPDRGPCLVTSGSRARPSDPASASPVLRFWQKRR